MPAFKLTQGAAYLVITAITGTIYSILAYLIRIFIRFKLNPPFGKDDILCTLATLFTILNSALVLTQSAYGLGHHAYTISPSTANMQRILGWLAVLAFVQASTFSILSITFLLIRVTHLTSQARPAYLVAAATALWSLTATTIILFQCALPQPWKTRPHSRCIDIYTAWLCITAFRALLETANVLLAAVLLWKLKMPLRLKVTIVAMFALRLLVLPPALTRLHYIELTWKAADWTYARVNVQILTQVTMHVSTILATVPCVKNFLLVFDSGNLHPPRITMAAILSEGPLGAGTRAGPLGSGRRALPPTPKRKASLYALRPLCPTLTGPSTAGHQRARSDMDLRHGTTADPATATRPGPVHTLRMTSWSAPGGLTTPRTPGAPASAFDEEFERGLQTLSTAEHDPEDARYAELERRGSQDSRRRIKRSWSFSVDWRERSGGGSEAGVDGGIAEGASAARPKVGRQTSVGSCWSLEERGLVKEESTGEV